MKLPSPSRSGLSLLLTATLLATPALATSPMADVAESRTITTPIPTPPTETVVVKETTIYGQQLATLLKDRKDASRYHGLLATSGLDRTLDGLHGYTVFVPLDSAFAGSTLGQNVTPGVPDPAVQSFLKKTIVSGKYDTKLLHGDRDHLTTLSGETVTIGKGNAGTYYANGVRIVDTFKNEQAIIYFVKQPVVK